MSSSDTPWTYIDPGSPPDATYTVVPPPAKINFPVGQIGFDLGPSSREEILTLCEVFVFGGKSYTAYRHVIFVTMLHHQYTINQFDNFAAKKKQQQTNNIPVNHVIKRLSHQEENKF